MEKQVEYENEFLGCDNSEKSEQLLRKCGDGAMMVSMHDNQGAYLKVSESSTGFIGYSPGQLVGNSAYDYFHPEDFQNVLKSHAQVTIVPGTSEVYYRLRLPNGGYKKVRSLSKQLVGENNQHFILVFTIES